MSQQKEVIYIDVEDDITSIIDKAVSSKSSIAALVLPKKTPTLKSSVNMKLLNNSVKKAKKKVVLITNESALLPLAGAAGVHVAENLKTRPSIPEVDKPVKADSVVDEEDPDLNPKEEVGTLAAAAAGGAAVSGASKGESVKKAASAADTGSGKSEKIKNIKDSARIKVPNFDKFKMRAILAGALLIGLIVLWFVMFRVMPKASVTIQAQTSRVPIDIDVTLDSDLKETDVSKRQVPAVVNKVEKSLTERFDATGEKDVGKKASGNMTVQNCDSSDEVTVAKGTRFTDPSSGSVFVSNSAVEVPGGSFSGGECSDPGEATVKVTATEGGDDKNLSARSYNVSGVGSLITGYGGQMSGGTSEIKKIVKQEDIDGAKAALLAKTDESIKSELSSKFEDGQVAIVETFEMNNTEPNSNVKAGDEVNEGTVSADFIYSMVGVDKNELSKILKKEQMEQIDSDSLAIIDTGVDEAKLSVSDRNESGSFVINTKASGYVGPDINTEELAKEIQGKRYSDIVSTIKSKPGVSDVQVDLSPFWVFSAPGPDKTTIEIVASDDGVSEE